MDNRCLAAFIEAGLKVVVVIIVVVIAVVIVDSKSDDVTSRLLSRMEISGINIFLQNSGALEFGLLLGKLDVRKPARLPV